MELNALLIFNSVVVVIWTVNPLPKLIESKRHDIIALATAAIVLINWGLYTDNHTFPYNLLGGLVVAALSLAGGHIMHRYSKDWQQDQED